MNGTLRRADTWDGYTMSRTKPQPQRGASLLLFHCAAVADERPSARSRLEDELGGELARLLVFALVGPQGRRGSSSP
jgi:hypothetical protein